MLAEIRRTVRTDIERVIKFIETQTTVQKIGV